MHAITHRAPSSLPQAALSIRALRPADVEASSNGADERTRATVLTPSLASPGGHGIGSGNHETLKNSQTDMC